MNDIRLGMIGLSEGNGHPFSFSAILNGYDDAGLAASDWPVIYHYVRRRDASELGGLGARVTHAWTQEPAITQRLCAACRIEQAVERPEGMLGNVDAVIIARDDYETHLPLARPFLEAGLPVFVDKPLSLDIEELHFFRPFLESGQLMSCAGLRYARELDEARANLSDYGTLKLVRGAVILNWEKYGVHLLDALFHLLPSRPVMVTAIPAGHASFAIEADDGALWQLDALGTAPKTFHLDLWGEKARSSHELEDNFSAFRRTLWHFIHSIRMGRPAIPARDTIDVMRTLLAGRRAREEGRTVRLEEFEV